MYFSRNSVLSNMRNSLLFLLLVGFSFLSKAQVANDNNPQAMRNELIQLSGIVTNADSSEGLPLVSIGIKHSSKGTLTDESGYFSMVVKRTDTIVFSFIGYKTTEFVLPAVVKGIKYSIVQVLQEDTIYLNTAVIRTYPTPDEFNYYFVKASIPDAYYQGATRNLKQRTLQQLAMNMQMDGSEAGKYVMQQQAYRYYYNGQVPPNRVFDPFAWSQFYKAVKRGDYKKK